MKCARILASGALAAGMLGAGAAVAADPETAIFAGGCFWCMEEAYEKVPGVISAVSGYTGGKADDATYRRVSSGATGHYEVVEVEYDPDQVTYERLLDVFWRNIDPFDARGQFCDKGTQYLSAIFVANDRQRELAEATKAEVEAEFSMPVATEILPEQTFYPAEDYHQNYYKTTSARYNFYKFGCGRPQRLEELWGEPAA